MPEASFELEPPDSFRPAPRKLGMPRKANGDNALTPPWLLQSLGRFDLDPCAPQRRPWEMASRHYTEHEDGLKQPWEGRVWLHPPRYGIGRWMMKMVEHLNGVALLPVQTDTWLWDEFVWSQSDAVLFLAKKVNFFNEDGRKTSFDGVHAYALAAYGSHNARFLYHCGVKGAFVPLMNRVSEPFHVNR